MRRKRKGLKKETTEWINRSKRRSQEDEEREREGSSRDGGDLMGEETEMLFLVA